MSDEAPTVRLRNAQGNLATVNASDVQEWKARGYESADAKPADIDVVDPTPEQAVPAKRGRK
ncbi:hypothetical protein [Methylibium sp.]|uniref:hypothetical protein n=1 Tax=Methylibium sp. TaxID=2067992 RepID=UPI0018261B37|nr:hypothetical protein [Methylibium sp.]MBA3589676.1 hypothetical protein [Methylibium sp.]